MNKADDNPFRRFGEWFTGAGESEPEDPNAMALATVGADGQPAVRMVLLKDWDEQGFVFYTNLGSRKAEQLAENPKAALLFHWKSLRRQVRIEGTTEPVSTEEADAYFASRPRASRIGAWASRQSQPMKGRFEFEKRIAEFTAKFGTGTVPRPDFWSGYRLVPRRFEFWTSRKFRLHERHVYMREGDIWVQETLYP